jgi:predicted choloylglycine hydrolase
MRANLHIRKVLSPAFACLLLLSLLSCGISKSIHHQPKVAGYNSAIPVVKKVTPTHFTSGNNFLLKNKQNLWELYVEGDPLERGLAFGSLSDSLFKKQENVFFSKIKDILPSERKQKMLRTFLKWYNRKVYLNVTEEYKTEIYGMSRYASHEFDYVAPPYLRSLYLHGAHDIGHALQDLALVGCSSFAAWGDKSDDGSLIIGRNFDFYAGDEFAKDKIIAFVKPDQGYPFMSVTWAGLRGGVSGMNSEGLTVTLNAGKSKIPLVAKTPISILAREILQYSKNIDEAVAIAKKRSVFVSESIMIGSANDGKAVLIEVAPHDLDVYDVPNTNQLICTNHFQSHNLKDNKRNVDQIANSHSEYRYQRLTALIDENKKLNPEDAAAILRNKDGLKNIALGYGNEKALNQLLAHHGVIFKPEQRLVWVSANPYQLGEFVCYDLNAIFGKKLVADSITTLSDSKHKIERDAFLETDAYKNYEKFRIRDREMDAILNKKRALPENFVAEYQSLNPDYWIVYYKIGLAYYNQKDYRIAKVHFEKALTKEITTLPKKQEIEKYLRKIKRKLR